MRLDDYTVPETELKVRASMRIETKSLGGTTSASDRTNNGIKPKEFTVSLLIPFENERDLTALIKTAETVDSAGRLKVYTINERTANAMNVRQVQFTDNVSVREMEQNEAWRVSFMLVEYFSVAEKKEQRQILDAVKEQLVEGVNVATLTDTAASALKDKATGSILDQTPQLTGAESALQFFEDLLS
ncbi:DNA-binding protein [Pseudomaricurvus alkylphenolicus]|uniref:baseplate complex protein n=1 Tax=Pseudomaricurvus alkylphenolicus TaxID=1306991 RepID=UPI00141F31DE|nr:DNA-binding protein [Pseudomaricurvus alkylphenolicus]NIB44764.1 DNA-binding protein [Pseudomaricurvus alkylphenolicus]